MEQTTLKEKQKRFSRIIATAAMLTVLIPATSLFACGYGNQGGADYIPQQQNQQQVQGQPISADQARQIVSRYIMPINPNLTIGTPNDAGPYYEVDLFGKNGQKVQILAVDKFSGQIKPLS